MSWIESYSFGKIVIDAVTYREDVILLDKEVRSGWWRKEGHILSLEDLKVVMEYEPELLIIGTGSSGMMTVPKELVEKLDFTLEHHPTKKACERYNEELKRETRLAGAFHLTC